MGGLRVSALLLGLLCLIPGAVRPGDAQEKTSGPPDDYHVAPTIPFLVNSSEFPDVSVSSGAPGPPDVASEAPDNDVTAGSERPPPPPTISAPESDDAVSSATTAAGDITRVSDETTSGPDRVSPATASNDPTSMDATEPAPPSTAPNVTADTVTETRSLLATLGVTAGTQLREDATPHTTLSASVPSTWMSAITTASSAATPSDTTAPHTTRAEEQQGPSVLKVGDDKDASYHSRNSSNYLLVMSVSVFTVMVVMMAAAVCFRQYKKRNSRTEFRRLQDLPMDDMMEDTPLSLYSY